MIHYHGGPITPVSVAVTAWARRHAMVSFAYREQLSVAAEVCQSFTLDNGAFTAWKQGIPHPNWADYSSWIDEWERHPGFDWCLIPDCIDGTENDNDDLIAWWVQEHVPCFLKANAVPIWHLHEGLERLTKLARDWHRIAFGSSGEYSEVGTDRWWHRMGEAMTVVCENGRPITKLHGLRMLNPTVFSQFPFASCDSTNVARNLGIDDAWSGPYQPASKATRAQILMERVELHASASRWTGTVGTQMNFELLG